MQLREVAGTVGALEFLFEKRIDHRTEQLNVAFVCGQIGKFEAEHRVSDGALRSVDGFVPNKQTGQQLELRSESLQLLAVQQSNEFIDLIADLAVQTFVQTLRVELARERFVF